MLYGQTKKTFSPVASAGGTVPRRPCSCASFHHHRVWNSDRSHCSRGSYLGQPAPAQADGRRGTPVLIMLHSSKERRPPPSRASPSPNNSSLPVEVKSRPAYWSSSGRARRSTLRAGLPPGQVLAPTLPSTSAHLRSPPMRRQIGLQARAVSPHGPTRHSPSLPPFSLP